MGLQLCVNVGWYAFLSANLHEDEASLLALLGRADGAAPALRCRAMAWAGLLAIGNTGERTWALDAIDVARTASAIAGHAGRTAPEHRGQAMALRAVEEARRLGEAALVVESCAFAALHVAGVGAAPVAVGALVAEARSANEDGDVWWDVMLDAIDALATYVAGDLDAAARELVDAISRFRALGDEGTAALFEISLDEVIELSGDIAGAAAAIERAYELGRAAAFQSSTTLGPVLCGWRPRNGDTEQALAIGREVLAAAHRPFNPVARAQALFALGVAELQSNLVDDAATHLAEAFEIHARYGMKRELAMDHTRLGYVAAHRGDHPAALRHHRSAVHLAAEIGLPWTVMLTCCGLIEALSEAGEHQEACRLTGFIDAIGRRHGYPLVAAEQAQVDAVRRAARDVVGVESADAAEREGAALEGADLLRA
jgi:tetratricopeptide (TPR) repeat protein